MKKFLLFIIGLVLISCSTQRQLIRIGHSPEFKEGWYTIVRNYHVMDIEEPNFFLAVGEESFGPSVIAVSILPEEGPVYNGKKVRGPYVMIDTYSYKTTGGGVNTVPLVVSLSHYVKMKNIEKTLGE